MNSNLLFANDSDSDNECSLNTNKEYAKSYNKFRSKELLKKLKDKNQSTNASNSSDDSSTDSDSTDNEMVDPKFNEAFFQTLATLKKRDSSTYDANVKFFDEFDRGIFRKREKSKEEENKKKAIEQHFASIEPYHENLESYECGLIFNQKFPKFVASPDGIVSCDCHGQGCVVTKCLKILEPDVSFDVLTQKPNNILKNIENEYFMEETHEYFYQVQLQIHVTDLNYCDFTIWSPTHFLIVRVIADPEFWKKTMQKALVFHEQVMMPELLGKFYTKADSVISMEEDEENTYELFELEIELLNSMSDA